MPENQTTEKGSLGLGDNQAAGNQTSGAAKFAHETVGKPTLIKRILGMLVGPVVGVAGLAVVMAVGIAAGDAQKAYDAANSWWIIDASQTPTACVNMSTTNNDHLDTPNEYESFWRRQGDTFKNQTILVSGRSAGVKAIDNASSGQTGDTEFFKTAQDCDIWLASEGKAGFTFSTVYTSIVTISNSHPGFFVWFRKARL